MDVVRVGDREYRQPGGSPLNVAFGLARLGIGTRFLARIGSDADGSAIRRHLVCSGVTILDESVDSAKTSVAIATVEPDGSATYSFDVDWRLATFGESHRWKWIHAGFLATFLPPGADSLEHLLHTLKDATRMPSRIWQR